LQVKSKEKLVSEEVVLKPRLNVEKYWLHESDDPNEFLRIPVFKFDLDTSLLETARVMGPAAPLLLILVCLESKRLFYLCLTDYVDKVITPQTPAFTDQTKLRIVIPEHDEITAATDTLTAFKLYAKRAKLYAAFTKFQYQFAELEYIETEGRGSEREILQRFLYTAKNYDIWNVQEWRILPVYRAQLERFGERLNGDVPLVALLSEARELWRRLALLGRNLEDLTREWFLPTHIGCLSSDAAFY
jgi:hypothetical protein